MDISEIIKDVYIHCFDDDFKYPDVLNALNICAKRIIEKMKCCGNCIHCKYDENEESYEFCEKHNQVVNIAIQPCSEYETYNFDKAIKEIKE